MKTLLNIRIDQVMGVSLGVIALMIPVAGFSGEDIDKTLEMPADGLVSVENMVGRIEFVAWDRAEVQIRGEAGDDVEEVEFSATSKGVRVRVRNEKGGHHIDGTDLYLRVPENASIQAESVSADMTVSGSRGDNIVLSTVSGDLEVDSEPNRLEMSSVSGDVEFDGAVSRSIVETVSGEITLTGVAGEINASTVSGDLSLEAGEVSRGRFESVSGDLTLSLSLDDSGRLSADSMSGDLVLKLPGSQDAEFTAQSYSGDIHSDFGESVRVSRGPGVMLEHRAGDNGAEIRLESFSGDILIRSR